MEENNNFYNLYNNLNKYKRKSLYKDLIKGILLFLFFSITMFLAFTFAEYISYFTKETKTILFGLYVLFSLIIVYNYLVLPIKNYSNYKNHIADEDAAKTLSTKYPSIKDSLLNTIQLIKSSYGSDLALESINQRITSFSNTDFSESIDFKENRKTSYLLIIPSVIILLSIAFAPSYLVDGTKRFVDFNNNYEKPSPFHFSILNSSLEFTKNEKAIIQFEVAGDLISENVYFIQNETKHKVFKNRDGKYSYSIDNIQESFTFQIQTAGYNSKEYNVSVFSKPNINNIVYEIVYPPYTSKKPVTYENTSKISVPKGTEIKWKIFTSNTKKTNVSFSDSTTYSFSENEDITFDKKILNNIHYQVITENNHTSLTSNENHITVIEDLNPKITLEQFKDTNLFNYITLTGSVSDDYGISKLVLKYKSSDEKSFNSIIIPISKKLLDQQYLHNWVIDTLLNKNGLEYFLEVYDNDEVNGIKSTRTSLQKIKQPSKKEINKKLNADSEGFNNQMEEALEKLNETEKEISELNKKLKAKKKLSWNDKEEIKKTLERQKEVHKEIQKLNEKLNDLLNKQEKFEKPSESIKAKAEKLQKLMEEVLDEETKKMMEELEKLLEQNQPKDQNIKDLMDKMNEDDTNLEKELDRTLELFKKLQLEQKMEKIASELEELAEEQEKLAEKTPEKENTKEELQKEQEKLNEEFEELKEEMKEMEKMNEEINQLSKEQEEELEQQKEETSEEMEKSSEELSKGNKNKAQKSQKSAAQKMKKMSESMKSMMGAGSEQQETEDLNALRQILDNLIKLSFDQEIVMNNFKNIRKVNPKYVDYSIEQAKIRDNSQIIEDSLLALASRVFQIESFITTELFEMNDKIDKSLGAIKDRNIRHISLNQQLAMTSINNLALMLSDVMQQMQEQMAESKPGDQMCNKPGGKGKKPGKSEKMSDLQKQLNQQIQGLKKSGKSGKQLSEELGKMAAQQEAIRNALREMEKEGGKNPGEKGENGKEGKNGKIENSELEKLMEETENDLVNKRLLQKTINRQEEILTRLLEAENAMRERDQEKKRESETARDKNRTIPPNLEKYLSEKKKEIDLLKKVDNSYSNYYKKEVNKYFNELKH